MLAKFSGVFLVLAVCTTGIVADDEKSDTKAKKLELSEDEQSLLDLTNAARKKENLSPLKANKLLFEVARAHSANMAKQGKMEHVLDGKNPAQRAEAGGYRLSSLGENIAAGFNWSLETVMKTWMQSPPHRANILQGKYTEIGIGIVRGDNKQVYYTQVFGTPRRRR